MSDALGDRMKAYERREGGRVMPLLPVCARVDGRCFSAFTRGLERPFDARLSRLMRSVTRDLVASTQARVGYTQSDEISLLWHSERAGSQIFMDGRIQKMVSLLAALATASFLRRLPAALPEKADLSPVFDARVWTVPSRAEAVNVLLWRELDATRNSVSMAARSRYPHARLQGRSRAQLMDLLMRDGVNWNDYPTAFKRGSWLARRTVERRFSGDELAALPPRHQARSDPDLVVTRSDIVAIEMPPFSRVVNREAVIFDGAEPRLAERVSG